MAGIKPAYRLAGTPPAAQMRPNPELFFPFSGSGQALEQIAEAKAICAGCPVRRQCLEFALRTRPQAIWGGLTELERTWRRPMGQEHAPPQAALADPHRPRRR
jgi:WhiB family redox-sensing transcriptional regulator